MWVVIAGVLVACRHEGPNPHHRDGTDDDPTAVHTGWAHTALDHTGLPSGETAALHTGGVPACDTLPTGPVGVTSSDVISTEEDFDFDATGLLLAQNYSSIVGTDRYGATTVVATGLSGDAAGIRVAPNGDFVYASPDDGRLVGVSRANGGSRTLLSGLRVPNSVEMDTAGIAFVAEFWSNGRIVWLDTNTLESGEVGRLDYVNGMTLSNDERVLYVASANGYWTGPTTIYAADRAKDGTFSGLREITQLPTLVTSLAVDDCDNLYLLAYNDGRVFRYDVAADVFTELANLGGIGYAGFSSIRFSPGLGGFSTTALYATNRLRLYEVDVGIGGRHVLR